LLQIFKKKFALLGASDLEAHYDEAAQVFGKVSTNSGKETTASLVLRAFPYGIHKMVWKNEARW
jgi:hypothetical protein